MKIAVLGSGNGGCAVAAEWALAGHQVSIFDFPQFAHNIKAINEKGGIEIYGKLNGFAKVDYAGHDIKNAINDASFIFVVGPAYSIESFGKALKEHINKGQIVCVCPSSGGGAIIMKRALGVELENEDYIVCETSTLPYACRAYEPGKVNVYHRLRGGLYISALPGNCNQQVYDIFQLVYKEATPAKSVLMTMMITGNTIIHPSVTLLNASRIESTNGDFYFYEDGATPAAGRLMEALDKEKLALSDALDAGLIPDIKVKVLQTYSHIESYEDGYRTAPGFKGIKAQNQLDHRYFHEDVGYGLVFISELAKQVGIKTPVIDAVILIVSTIMKRDYRKEGKLTPKTLGIDQYSVEEMKNIFTNLELQVNA